MMPFRYPHEFKRKAIHLSSLWIPLLYAFISKNSMLAFLLVLTVIVLSIDIFRHRHPVIRDLSHSLFKNILRTHEIGGGLSGASFMLIGALFTVALFSKMLAIVALMVLVISDTCAAIVGKEFGKTPLLGKTREGTLAFIISGWIVTFIVLNCFNAASVWYWAGIFAVLVGAAVELFSKRFGIDDNLSIPLSVGASMWLFSFIL